jgi:hypothetical protein
MAKSKAVTMNGRHLQVFNLKTLPFQHFILPLFFSSASLVFALHVRINFSPGLTASPRYPLTRFQAPYAAA